jgi:hypothetical protein
VSDDLQRQLAEFLKFLLAQAQDATTWAKTQIPPLIEDKIRFGRVWHVIVMLLCIGGARISLFAVRWCWRKIEEADEWIMPMIASAIATAVLVVFAFDNLHDAVLAWLSPRLYIVQWLVELTTSHKEVMRGVEGGRRISESGGPGGCAAVRGGSCPRRRAVIRWRPPPRS